MWLPKSRHHPLLSFPLTRNGNPATQTQPSCSSRTYTRGHASARYPWPASASLPETGLSAGWRRGALSTLCGARPGDGSGAQGPEWLSHVPHQHNPSTSHLFSLPTHALQQCGSSFCPWGRATWSRSQGHISGSPSSSMALARPTLDSSTS